MEDAERCLQSNVDYENEYYRLSELNSILEKDIGELHCQNEILRAKLEIVYLIFGNGRVEQQ